MRKASLVFFSLFFVLTSTAFAKHSEAELERSINILFDWQENNATIRNFPGSVAADFYIMSLVNMGYEYDFDSYIELTENINPPTKQDGQRLIMTNSACQEKLDDSFVGWYTYNSEYDNASDLSGAITALDSGNYEPKNSAIDLNNMVYDLLSMQQSNGSFSNDILTTAKAIIALSPRMDSQYKFHGSNTGEEYNYDCKSAINNAVLFLGASQKNDGGYITVMNTAYVIMALNSVNINPETEAMFQKNGNTPIDYIVSNISSDGSVFSSADDTALSSAALVSQLKFKKNHTSFFSFNTSALSPVQEIVPVTTDKDQPVVSESTEAHTEQPQQTTDTSVTATPSPTTVIEVRPQTTRAPEHSATVAELHGPLPFVGPVRQENVSPSEEPLLTEQTSVEESSSDSTKIYIAIAIASLSFIGFIVLTVLRRKSRFSSRLKPKISSVAEKESKLHNNDDISTLKSDERTDCSHDFYKSPEVVPKEELYDPDFVKKLVPVDEIDTSIGSIIAKPNSGDIQL